MTSIESSIRLRRTLAKITNTSPEDWFLCLKARFGMAIIFRAIHDVLGAGEVLTTPYTCITAINPILAGNLTPRYLDIDPDLLALSSLPDRAITKNTRAVVMQHTLGLIANKQNLVKSATRHRLILVEDSAHCLLRLARDHQNHPLADLSVHSFGVEKVLPATKFGGAIYVNPHLKTTFPALYARICEDLISLPAPDRPLSARVRRYRPLNALLGRLPAKLKSPFRDFVTKAKLLEPAIYDFEQEGRQSKPYTTDTFTNEQILKQLPTLTSNYRRRETSVKYYRQHLKSTKFQLVPPTDHDEPLLAYPILFENQTFANYAYDLLTSAGFFIRRWYMPLLYPGPKYYQLYYYKPANAPLAEAISPRILCLPTDLPLNRIKQLVSLISTVEKPVDKSSKSV